MWWKGQRDIWTVGGAAVLKSTQMVPETQKAGKCPPCPHLHIYSRAGSCVAGTVVG